MNGRFGSNHSLDFYVLNSTNTNTQQCTDKWINYYNEWVTAKNKDIDIEKLAPIEIDLSFDAEVRGRDGTEYEPNSIAGWIRQIPVREEL